ncbi:MAG: prolyl oligopeptidase family serine peptidase [Streptosporangiales bacterium]|nr:prolyl oligopeptidase family serine peptidase [Streptosporangiales bacterium]
MTESVALPFGTWPSPISAGSVAGAGLRLGFPTVMGDDFWWQETRPGEGGRTTIMHRGADGTTADVLPAPWSARTRVHEYGGRSYLVIPGEDGPAVLFANFTDQRLYLVRPGADPAPLTPEPDVPGALRYADYVLSPDGSEVWCVHERHTPRAPVSAEPAGAAPAGNGAAAVPVVQRHPAEATAAAVSRAIVAVPLDGSAAGDAAALREIVAGSHFLASPRPSPDGTRLAWVAWEHPRMPWDGTQLRMGLLGDSGTVERAWTIKGGVNESVVAPLWADERSLYVASDWPGWWNLYRISTSGESPEALYPAEEEFAGPLWQLGGQPFARLSGERIALVHGHADRRLGVYDSDTLELTDLDTPYGTWGSTISADGDTIVGVAGGPVTPNAVVSVNAATGEVTVLREEPAELPDAAYLPTPREIEFEGHFGRKVHAFVYPPSNPKAHAPEGAKPPYVVWVHGGPTGAVNSTLDLEKAYFTSRGIGIVDVNYGGSVGYGRAYRERLRGQWGVVDVEDSVGAAQALVDAGEADGARLAIRGGSAGGWTTLAALTSSGAFAAGTSYFGISELSQFAEETHDFESRYLDGLIGPLPGFARTYAHRSPLTHADKVTSPVLLLQGLDDPIVLPAQSERFAAALAERGVRHAYLAFEGESHGFRKASTIVTCLEAELSFYGQVFGFMPPEVPELKLQGEV